VGVGDGDGVEEGVLVGSGDDVEVEDGVAMSVGDDVEVGGGVAVSVGDAVTVWDGVRVGKGEGDVTIGHAVGVAAKVRLTRVCVITESGVPVVRSSVP
jgi:acetyltransferase-like isoleucine patch superfamily enzyme